MNAPRCVTSGSAARWCRAPTRHQYVFKATLWTGVVRQSDGGGVPDVDDGCGRATASSHTCNGRHCGSGRHAAIDKVAVMAPATGAANNADSACSGNDSGATSRGCQDMVYGP